MPLSKAQKQERVAWLQQQLAGASTLILAGFTALTVEQDYELRTRVRAAGARYRVVKNSLAERAAAGTPAEAVLKNLAGVNSLAYTSGDAVALAKALEKYAQDYPTFTVRAAVVEGAALSAQQVAQLASLPSRDELMAKLLFMIQAPAQRLASTLQAVARNTAGVVDQAVKAKKFAE
ncbi:MAG TPA: 50S ribosomal protein L10 [Terriglobales bacterium]|nr:50S ribosomal protein L10 [Terriglobales bacterium]